MAESVHLFLKANGKAIQGESTQRSLGRENSIECLSFEQEVITAREAGTAMATGRRQYNPLTVQKRIDKSSPLLMKSLCKNEMVEGEFKFFRPSPTGDGTTQQFYTIKIERARISSIKQLVQETNSPTPPMEEISFVFHTITWTYTDGGVEHTDRWDEQA